MSGWTSGISAPRILASHEATRGRTRLLGLHPGWFCVVAALALSILGASAIALSAPAAAHRQLLFLGLGVLAAVLAACPSPRQLRRLAIPFYLLTLGMLVLLLIPGIPEAIVRPRNGARRWISLVVTDLQPSELAKIAFILLLALQLRYRRSHRTFMGLLPVLASALVPMALVLLEPDLGTALLFLPTLFAVLIVAGARWRDLGIVVLLGVTAAGAMAPMLRPHQVARIKALVAQVQGDDRYEHDIGYQGARSMTLIGSGGLHGHEEQQTSMLLRWNHLPERHNDMIFTVICTRWGMTGAVIVWGLYGLFAVGGLWTAAMCRDPFGRLVAIGITTIIMAQMVVNAGMTLGLFPITGMTLPFVSYGGSSLVVTWLMVGLLVGIARHRGAMFWKESFEFDGRGAGDR